MESHSYREQFLEDMAAWLRQQEQSDLFLLSPSVDTTESFSSADVVWLDKMGISLRPDTR
jgi:hypothetical protein